MNDILQFGESDDIIPKEKLYLYHVVSMIDNVFVLFASYFVKKKQNSH